MDSFINTFHIDWKIIIAQSINFVIVLFVLNLLIVKPLKKMMKERSLTISGGLDDAAQNKELLMNTKKEYDNVLIKAREEAHTIFQEGKREAEDKKKEMIDNTHKEIEEMISSGKKILESEKIKMVEEAKKEIVSLVVKATEKLLESHKDESFNNKALEQIKKL